MNKPLIVSAIILVANSGCASERLYVKVIDELGRPVTNYDEYSLSLDIADKVESARSRGEYEDEVRRRNGVVEKRNKYDEEFPQIEVEFQ